LLEQIGSGGMGMVHRAVVDGPKGFERFVVIKRVRPELARDGEFVDMLAAEARLCALLRHPGIVHVHEFGEIGGEFYLTMELVDGHSLLAIFKASARAGARLPPGVVCFIVSELAAALAYAHALTNTDDRPLDIVHRDVSPANVMLTRSGGVKLLDFGIAKAATHIRDDQTRTGTLRGKLSYMSPEQAEGLPIDRRTDIFALGVLFWECLTLKRLFKGQTDFETLRLIRQARVPAPSTVVEGLDADIDAVVLKMLAPELERRYASCDEVVAALAPIVHRHHGDAGAVRQLLGDVEPMLATPPVAGEREPAATPATELARHLPAERAAMRSSSEPRPSTESEVRRRTRLRRGWLAAVGAVLAVGGAWLIARAPSTEPARAAAPPPPIAATAHSTAVTTPKNAAPAPAARKVRLHLRGSDGAEVTVDGALVGQIPLDIELPRADQARHLQVRRRGFVPWARTIAGNTDVALSVVLRRATRERPRPAAPTMIDGPKIRNPFDSP
jgi:eukaryotic-like serine/threonine-protein kinase